MALVLPSQTKGTVTTPTGDTAAVQTSELREPEARLLRAYQGFLFAQHLNAVRVCQRCGQDVDLRVAPGFIGAACACHLRTYALPSPALDVTWSVLPEPVYLVTPDGDPVPRMGIFTPQEAALLRDYKRLVLQALAWREKVYCDDCFRANRKEGTSFHVLDHEIGLRCRCREQTWRDAGIH